MAISRKELIRSGQLCNPPMPKRLLTKLRRRDYRFLFFILAAIRSQSLCKGHAWPLEKRSGLKSVPIRIRLRRRGRR
jgi:hypothetical protein